VQSGRRAIVILSYAIKILLWEIGKNERETIATNLEIIITTWWRVGSCKHWCPRIEYGCYSCFCNGYCLLLHGFVNSHSDPHRQNLKHPPGNTIGKVRHYLLRVQLPILWPHFVKLINTDNTSIGQNHGSSFKIKFTLKSTYLWFKLEDFHSDMKEQYWLSKKIRYI